MVQDFQNAALQGEWDSFRTGILTRRNDRHAKLAAQNAALQQQRQMRNAQSAQRTAALDERMDALNARFADGAVAATYNAQRVHDAVVPAKEAAGTNSPKEKVQHCLGERAHWIDCQTKYAADSRPCNAYLSALEQCVSKTVMDSNMV